MKAFLITKSARRCHCHGRSTALTTSTSSTTHPPTYPWQSTFSGCNHLSVKQSGSLWWVSSLIWHLLDLPSLFIHPSCPNCLCRRGQGGGVELVLLLLLLLLLQHLQLYQSALRAYQINSHQNRTETHQNGGAVIYDAIYSPHSGPECQRCPNPLSKYVCVCAFERYILRRKYAGLHIANILRRPSPSITALSLSLPLTVSMLDHSAYSHFKYISLALRPHDCP